MKPRRILTQQDAAVIFEEAVRDRALAVLTLQNGTDWQCFKSRFLECDPNRRFFVLDYQPVNNDTLPELGPGQYIGVSFRQHNRKILFATVVEARGHYLFDRTSVPAVRYRWPEDLTELQRRAFYRTLVPENMTLLATLWPGGAAARTAVQAKTLQAVTGTLADVSCGGALVRLSELAPPAWTEDETLGVELHLADGRPPAVTNACFRGFRNDQLGQLNAAFQFIGLELNVDGRLVLQRLANCVQKLHRLGIASGSQDWNRPAPE